MTTYDGNNLAGVAAILIGMLAMSINDFLVKFLGSEFPLHQSFSCEPRPHSSSLS
ncbi:hypothetical protein [Mesorhizobium sp.]|uniref:hypothetical protein n=1 Tax=Mesorhizobium sp. TaxID=1871066 RepID=UPI0025BD1AFB|nr:hypothetical protein [Mesorhizobium sp.]